MSAPVIDMCATKYCYLSLVALRFVLTLMPQSGYVHPDEFFQSSEIVYGDMFGVMSLRTWEFETEKPIRNIAFPYVMTGFPAVLFSIFNLKRFLGTELFPYLMLVLPRFLMCSLSLVHDLCLYKICKYIKKNPFDLLMIFASSYVTLVYLTRTFSNSLEAACLTLLIYSILPKSPSSQKWKPKTTLRDFDDRSLYYVFIGILFTCGCFIRPTFVLFAFIPIIYWLIVLSDSFSHQFRKLLSFSLAIAGTSLFLAFIDTMYYAGECNIFTAPSYNELKKMIFTPLNFIMYNLDAKKLSHHGRHPRYLHFVVNLPLMYSVLGLYGLFQCLKIMTYFIRKRTLNCSKTDLFLLLSFILPLIFLSTVPHQEPRFLIPIILPLICLCGEQLYAHMIKYKVVACTWVMMNVLGILFFGVIHQGGVYPALTFFHKEVTKNPTNVYSIVFYHTYMPPRHLLAIPSKQKNVKIYDLAGSEDNVLLESVQSILKYSRPKERLYIVAPSTITISLININIMLEPDYEVRQLEAFFPHISMEDMPPVFNLWLLLKNRSSFQHKLTKLKLFCSLNVYEIKRIKKS